MAEAREMKGGELPGNFPSEWERGLMIRILSDTIEFPVEFRNWLKNFIENAAIKISETQIVGGGGGFRPNAWPAGTVIAYAGGTAPPNSLPCNGGAVSRTTYADLFDAIGEIWGPGDGTTTFNVPDFRDRALYGQGSKVSLASDEGGALGTRGPRHYHNLSGSTGGGGAHNHSISGTAQDAGNHAHYPPSRAFLLGDGTTYTVNSSSGSQRYLAQDVQSVTGDAGTHSHVVSGGASDVGDHTHGLSGTTTGSGVIDAPAYAGVLYLIATGTIS